MYIHMTNLYSHSLIDKNTFLPRNIVFRFHYFVVYWQHNSVIPLKRLKIIILKILTSIPCLSIQSMASSDWPDPLPRFLPSRPFLRHSTCRPCPLSWWSLSAPWSARCARAWTTPRPSPAWRWTCTGRCEQTLRRPWPSDRRRCSGRSRTWAVSFTTAVHSTCIEFACIGRCLYWLIDWLIDSLIDWLIDSFIHSLMFTSYRQYFSHISTAACDGIEQIVQNAEPIDLS